jgi:hypothetical protein
MSVKKIDFSNPDWKKESLVNAYYFFKGAETPEFTQQEDCIATCANPNFSWGYDDISLVTTEQYDAGVELSLTCAFEGRGCPEIIFVEDLKRHTDGSFRYGPCFEVVLHKGGLNVWHHFLEDGSRWHKHLGLSFPVAENETHTLRVKTAKKMLLIQAADQTITLHVEDLPERFHVGLTGCEGIVRLHEMTISE